MIFDLSQKVFASENYPTHPNASHYKVKDMNAGDKYNLTCFSMCAHNGTHVDAPHHFIKDGKSIDQMPLESFMGWSYVVEHQGDLTKEDAQNLLNQAHNTKRLLIKGDAVVTLEAAEVFADADLVLLGNESCSVGPVNAPMAVHLVLLKKEITLLENIRLSHVPEGKYWLNAIPLALEGSDGSPCRAVLITPDEFTQGTSL